MTQLHPDTVERYNLVAAYMNDQTDENWQSLRRHLGAPQGGFDGIVIDFGDGCDSDTIDTYLGELLARTCLRLTLSTGESFDAAMSGTTGNDDGVFVVQYRKWDEETGYGTGDVLSVPFELITGIHVY